MPNQKPTLEYGRPEPSHGNLPLNITRVVFQAANGAVCLLISADWTWNLFHYSSATTTTKEIGFFGVFLPCLGLLLLLLAWKQFKRLKS